MSQPRAPEGWTLYAVGDIHGRLDLFEGLLDRIDADLSRLPEGGQAALILLGDYVDRGPKSREVIELARSLEGSGGCVVHALKGNHEEALLDFLREPGEGPVWGEFGGVATLASYGIGPPTPRSDRAAWERARDTLAAAMPPEHLAFLQGLALSVTYCDYLFVHAGVRPRVPVADQDPHDLMWIRHDFLKGDWRGPPVVVHCHTPSPEPQLEHWRIGVDTGAYATGVLTAVRLEGTGREILQARSGQVRPGGR
ncbi:metallophosphoesterase family protein [soil metagenome]